MNDKKKEEVEQAIPAKKEMTEKEASNPGTPVQDGFTEVKNANASGLGSLGGHDEDMQLDAPGQSADDY